MKVQGHMTDQRCKQKLIHFPYMGSTSFILALYNIFDIFILLLPHCIYSRIVFGIFFGLRACMWTKSQIYYFTGYPSRFHSGLCRNRRLFCHWADRQIHPILPIYSLYWLTRLSKHFPFIILIVLKFDNY